MGMAEAMRVIEQLASRGLFRERELKPYKLSHNWLPFAESLGLVKPQGHGVWSRPTYRPSQYEVLQLRFPGLVFGGHSALWLLGALKKEPEVVWIAIGNAARPPRVLDELTVVIRTRRLEEGVISWQPTGRAVALRVHDLERAQADIARVDCSRLLRGPDRFSLPRGAALLCAELPLGRWFREPEMPRVQSDSPLTEQWTVSTRLVIPRSPAGRIHPEAW